jgi:ribosomal protein L11 methyltransferase
MASTEWTQLTVNGHINDLDTISSVMSMLETGLMIEDYSDLSPNGMYGDLIDESLLNADKTRVAVSIFVPQERSVTDHIAFIKDRLTSLGVTYTISVSGVKEEDWAESWKQYYKPIHLGRVTIVPAWEKYTPKEEEVIVRMDPGMAFGTGTHETTRLVMSLLTEEVKGGERVLDVGTGSGILSICASKLGAKSCHAYDIDPVAVKVARENVLDNGCDNIVCGVSDLLRGVDMSGGGFDLCVANIVADIIIRMAPDIKKCLTSDGRLIVSGIISPRAQEVRDALTLHGMRVVREVQENDWLAILLQVAN